VKKSNVYENSGSFVFRMKLALAGVLLLAAIALGHHWEYLIVPILLGFVGYTIYRVSTDPVKPPKF
jgi:hypothetical protein